MKKKSAGMVKIAVDESNRSKITLTFPKKVKGYIKKTASVADVMDAIGGGGADVIGQSMDPKRLEIKGILRSNLCLGFGPNSEYDYNER
jgi:hypothetical protein